MNMDIFPDYNVLREAPEYLRRLRLLVGERDYINFDYLTLGWNVPLGNLKICKKRTAFGFRK